MNRKRIFWFLHFLGPILFVIFITKIIDFKQSLKILSGVNFPLILVSLLFFPIIISIRTLRWRVICQTYDISYTFWESLELYYIGWFFGAFIPQGMGTFTKTFYLKRDGYSLGKSFLTILLDKIFDLLGLIVFGSIGLIYFSRILPREYLSIIIPVIFMLFIVFICLRKKIQKIFTSLLNSYLMRKLSHWSKMNFNNVSDYLRKIHFKNTMALMFLSLSIAFLRSVSMYILALSLHLDMSFLFILACRSLVGIALVLPISFAGLGTRDSVLLLCFSAVGEPSESAISLGIVAFLWDIFFRFVGVAFWLSYSVKKLKRERI